MEILIEGSKAEGLVLWLRSCSEARYRRYGGTAVPEN